MLRVERSATSASIRGRSKAAASRIRTYHPPPPPPPEELLLELLELPLELLELGAATPAAIPAAAAAHVPLAPAPPDIPPPPLQPEGVAVSVEDELDEPRLELWSDVETLVFTFM